MFKTLRLDRATKINGWMTPEELTFLAEAAQNSNIAFEIGCFQGRSTRAIADNLPEKGKLFAIDPWNFTIKDVIRSDSVTYNQFFCNLHDHISSGKCIMCPTTWELYDPKDERPDFIFIDGNHEYPAVRHDIDKALKYLKLGGILAGHDYADPWDGVIKAVDETFSQSQIKTAGSIWWLKI